MPDTSYFQRQAEIFDRVADQCSMPELVPYYRKLAQDYRTRCEGGGRPQGEPARTVLPDRLAGSA